jgi:hypothetical protein
MIFVVATLSRGADVCSICRCDNGTTVPILGTSSSNFSGRNLRRGIVSLCVWLLRLVYTRAIIALPSAF